MLAAYHTELVGLGQSQELLTGPRLLLELLSRTDRHVRSTFATLHTIAAESGVFAPTLVNAYNATRDDYVATSKPIVDLIQKESQKRGIPPQPLTLPLRIDLPSGSTGQFGQAGVVPISHVRYTVPELGLSINASDLPLGFFNHEVKDGLGVPVVPVVGAGIIVARLVILGIVIAVGVAAAIIAEKLTRTKFQLARNDAARLQISSKLNDDATKQFEAIYVDCKSFAKTTDALTRCAKLAGKSTEDMRKAAQEYAKSSARPGGLGILSFIGLVVVIGGAGYIGYRIYKRRQAQKWAKWKPEAALKPETKPAAALKPAAAIA
jgi:hypothetical protein